MVMPYNISIFAYAIINFGYILQKMSCDVLFFTNLVAKRSFAKFLSYYQKYVLYCHCKREVIQNMKKLLMFFYLLPMMFLGMFYMFLEENIKSVIIFLLGFILPVAVSCLYGKTRGVLLGNLLYFISNISPILYLNKINYEHPTNPTSWRWYYKPLQTEDMFILLFVIMIAIEIISYIAVKDIRSRKKH